MTANLLSAALLAAFFVSGACAKSPTEPPEPRPGIIEVPAPTAYRQWWMEIGQCLGLNARIEAVHWFIADSAITEGSSNIFGSWRPHHITIADTVWNTRSADELRTVRHLMVHEILGTPDHPPGFETCAP